MATGETGVTSLTAAAMELVVLKQNSDDVGWEYGVLVDPLNKEKVWCLLCSHYSSGEIYHLKQHVGHVGSDMAKCKKTTPEAKDKRKRSLEEATRKRKEKIARDLNMREEVNVSKVGDEDDVACVESRVGSSEPHKVGPIDKWTRAIDPKATQAQSFIINKRSTKNVGSKEPMRCNNMLLDGCTHMVITSFHFSVLFFEFCFQFCNSVLISIFNTVCSFYFQFCISVFNFCFQYS
jgi:hypothetical protein